MKIICTLSLIFIISLEPVRAVDSSLHNQINQAVENYISDYGIPGVVVLIGHSTKNSYHQSWGTMDGKRSMPKNGIFDLASITKVFTASALLKVLEQKQRDEKNYISEFLPVYRRSETSTHSFEELLRHSSGLRASTGTTVFENGPQRVWPNILSIDPQHSRGSFKYSDVNYLVLGKALESLKEEPLSKVIMQEVLVPLKMNSSSFRPDLNLKICRRLCVPSRRGAPVGSVHDPTSFRLGGISGHAGLFASASDLSRFARMILNSGRLDGKEILSPRQVHAMTEKIASSSRGLGFDIESRFSEKPRGDYFAKGKSFGHTGYSGTSMWIDPTMDTFLIILANPVYAQDWRLAKKGYLKLITKLANIVGQSKF